MAFADCHERAALERGSRWRVQYTSGSLEWAALGARPPAQPARQTRTPGGRRLTAGCLSPDAFGPRSAIAPATEAMPSSRTTKGTILPRWLRGGGPISPSPLRASSHVDAASHRGDCPQLSLASFVFLPVTHYSMIDLGSYRTSATVRARIPRGSAKTGPRCVPSMPRRIDLTCGPDQDRPIAPVLTRPVGRRDWLRISAWSQIGGCKVIHAVHCGDRNQASRFVRPQRCAPRARPDRQTPPP